MPKREDIEKVLIIGSGPIIIGQACEFDYSGTQACKALRKLGYEIVLVNSNPATIMTDPEMADATYIEPLDPQIVEKVIEKERPDALLPNLGGQSGLNLSSELDERGVLEKYGVEIIGVQAAAIKGGEDRTEFKKGMAELGLEVPRSKAVYSVEEAEKVAEDLGYPVVVRPAYTLGGSGGGHVYNVEELREVAARGLNMSRVGQVLIEESILGWEELELEVVRDTKNRMVTVCFIENIDPVGVHTGDSFCSAPMLTVDEDLQEKLQEYSYRIAEAVKVIGGTNVQLAHDPETGRVVIIEMNPRTSRSSALASKATGFPIAMVSALLAAGLNLEEIPYWRDGTLDKYTPSGDYVVTKFARWAFEKFRDAEDKLGTQMRAVGEAMSLGKTYKESFQKSIRSLEIDRYGLGFAEDYNDLPLEDLMHRLSEASSDRQFLMYEAFRKGATIEEMYEKTYINRWFLRQMQELVELEEDILQCRGQQLPDDLLSRAKEDGFADRYLADLLDLPEEDIRRQREKLDLVQGWHPVPVSGVEEDAAYYYSTYNAPDASEASARDDKVMILGGGPNRIGQGIEFDYCCVHAAFALDDMDYETVMVNCNPETVSTDYDTSDKLYFEPLTVEDVLQIYRKEQPKGIICQFGGQTPLKIARELEEAGVNVLGTTPETIDLTEDRDRFRGIMEELGIAMAESGMASNIAEALQVAERIGYPLMVRPSYVLGGRGMEIVHDEQMLREYVEAAVGVTPDRPILIDKYLENAVEAEADALADGTDAYVPAVMEHIEYAGVHSGDSACVLPPISISDKHLDTIRDFTARVASELNVVGLMNMQYAIHGDQVYMLEANPRASRTVPLVSKVCGLPMARVATELMMGRKLDELGLEELEIPHYGVKEAVFPFPMFPEVDPVLGPEMKSTGEVLGMAKSFGQAFFKAQQAAGSPLPLEGTVLMTVCSRDRSDRFAETARQFTEMGFDLVATDGTREFLAERGIKAGRILKLHEGRPNINDAITNGEVDLIVNTPAGKLGVTDDSYIRKSAIKHGVPYITTVPAAAAAVEGIAEWRRGETKVRALQEHHGRME
ncbi:MAG: carbamoyl-phosphate synthase large subunit [Candidatus Brocadiia bacterium]